jgi:hypothetical protein
MCLSSASQRHHSTRTGGRLPRARRGRQRVLAAADLEQPPVANGALKSCPTAVHDQLTVTTYPA